MSERVSLTGGEVVVRELTFGEETEANSRAYVHDDGKPSHLDLIMVRFWQLVLSIEEGYLRGKNHDETALRVRALTKSDGNKLYDTYRRVNDVTPGESPKSDN